MKYYIASPGFNESQLKKIRDVESTLDGFGANYYSPFKNGDNLKLDDNLELNKLRIKHIFDKNIEEINSCSHMIALVDDFDKGTAFEIGYFAADRNEFELNDKLLLLGKLSSEVSKCIFESMELQKQLNTQFNILLFDLNDKNLQTYVTLGYLYRMGIRVVSYSNKELDSNVMTACACVSHIIIEEDELKEKYNELQTKFKDSHFQLSAMKFMTKVE